MNTLYKPLKMVGAVCLSCICFASKADPKIMTLEELRTFLDQQCQQGCKTLKDIREKIKAGNLKGFDPTHNTISYDVPKEFSGNFKGIVHVEYSENGELTFIETVNGWKSEVSEVLQIISGEDTPFRQYIRERFFGKTSAECLNGVSKELTAKELKVRGITDAEKDLLGSVSVREITFDSILESDFFDDTRRAKGRLCFENREELEKCIDAYVNKAVFLRSVTYRRKNTRIDWVTETSPNNSTFEIREEAQQPNEDTSDFVYKVSGDRRESMKEILANGLKNLLRHKNGKEKVILLLLLDGMTPSEFQLKWMHEDGQYGEYDAHKNWIVSDFETNGFKFLSHEIGHYLQRHLGLYRDLKTNDEFREAFEGYRMKFAKELLLTEPTEPKTAREMNIPSGVSCHIAVFYDNPHLFVPEISFDKLSEKDLFAHWQLVSRWDNATEAPDILGVYFNHSQKTIYVCALSDIRELKRIRYGHDPRNIHYRYLKEPNGEYLEKFETPEQQAAFENIVAKAAEQKPSIEVLRLLCKLHKRPEDESKVINLFDYDRESFLAQCLTHLQDYKTADK